jgi:hypothetical protein
MHNSFLSHLTGELICPQRRKKKANLSFGSVNCGTMSARVHHRAPAVGMGSPCVVCCSTDDALVDAANLTMACSEANALEKIQAWQNHPARSSSSSSSSADEPTVFLDFGDVKSAAWPLCQPCVSLLVRIDELEAEFVKAAGEFWRALDGSYELDPLVVAPKLEVETTLPDDDPVEFGDFWTLDLPEPSELETENDPLGKAPRVARRGRREDCPHCHKSVLKLRRHLATVHKLTLSKLAPGSSVIPPPSNVDQSVSSQDVNSEGERCLC